ncbi:MAG TPA: GIY-YIG nuclease family protein [Hymenobacter sp.]|jgi:group I intron endonuclease
MRFNIPDEHRNASGVYIIRNTINAKVYVGSAINFRIRFHHHASQIRKNKHHSIKLQNFINKYGRECLSFEIIQLCSGSKKQIRECEQQWINHHESYSEKGFNIRAEAGIGEGYKREIFCRCKACGADFISSYQQQYCTKECSKHGVSATHKGRKKPPEEIAKFVASRKANNPSYTSESARAKITQKLKGRTLSDEHRAAISAFQKGRKKSPEAIAKSVEARRNGKKRFPNEEARAKMRAAKVGIPPCAAAFTPEAIAKRTATRKANRQRREGQNST